MSKPITILVADDDPAILDVTRTILTELGGYQVRTVDRGEDLTHLADPLPDLILLDIWMSGVSGQEICQQLKNDERTADVPVILFSANRDLPSIYRECGADDFLAKPFQLPDLLQIVGKWTKA